MPTIQHQVIKPQKLVNTAVGMLEQELLIPNLFQKQGVDQFKGAENDTISMKVEVRLMPTGRKVLGELIPQMLRTFLG